MKKLLLTASAIFASAAFAEGFVTWTPTGESPYRVMTNTGDAEEYDFGYWFDYNDNKDGGASALTYPVAKGNAYSTDAVDPIIDELGGMGGAYSLAAGTLTYNPFIGIGFNVGGVISGDNLHAVDATAWGGFCVSVSVDHVASIELGVKSDVDNDNPAVTVPKGASTDKCYNWSDFKQAGWGTGVKMGGAEAAKQLTQFKFKIQDVDGSAGNVLITKVGPVNEGASASIVAGGSDPTPTPTPTPTPGGDAIISSAVAPVKAMLSGRTLSFSGINSAAAVEVVNLQGRVVVKGSATSSLNLANLDAGIYMVRVAGKSVDFAQKIVLK